MSRLSQSTHSIFRAVTELSQRHHTALIAIDGRSGSGKSRLAQALAAHLDCPVFHLDHFFLPSALRTPQRLAQPGGNIHYERVQEELLAPLLSGDAVCFRPWDCRSDSYGTPIHWSGGCTAVIEGSYALHPALRASYGLQIFLTCTPDVQRQRLLAREGATRIDAFLTQWIPLEEQYFSHFGLPEGCDFLLDTSTLEGDTLL